MIRDPAWNEGKRDCTLAMHPVDAEALKLIDGQQVRVTTEAGSEEIELEVTETAHKGHVVILHGSAWSMTAKNMALTSTD